MIANPNSSNINPPPIPVPFTYPKMPHRCPLCGGSGKLAVPSDYFHPQTPVESPEKVCHGCGGTGIIIC